MYPAGPRRGEEGLRWFTQSVATDRRILIRMAGPLRPNEHLWTRRTLGWALLRPRIDVVCDLGAVTNVGEPESVLLAMIRQTVEVRGGRVTLTTVASAIRESGLRGSGWTHSSPRRAPRRPLPDWRLGMREPLTEIRPGIYKLRGEQGSPHSYLVCGAEEIALIDTGFAEHSIG